MNDEVHRTLGFTSDIENPIYQTVFFIFYTLGTDQVYVNVDHGTMNGRCHYYT